MASKNTKFQLSLLDLYEEKCLFVHGQLKFDLRKDVLEINCAELADRTRMYCVVLVNEHYYGIEVHRLHRLDSVGWDCLICESKNYEMIRNLWEGVNSDCSVYKTGTSHPMIAEMFQQMRLLIQ
jgi:hypothetical protein